MNRRETIVTIIDTVEINPEIIKLCGHRVHTTEELRIIIKEILSTKPLKEKVAWSFGGIKVN